MTELELPIWRSMLFVPAHLEAFVAKARQRGADACILDLEDGVPAAQKEAARRGVPASATLIGQGGGPAVLVRVNQPWPLTLADLEAAVCPDVHALVLPKVGDAAFVQRVAQRLDALERERGMAPGHTRLIGQIEDVHALPRLDEIATATPRLMGLSLGSEDFSVSAGMAPVPQALLAPNQWVLFACRRAGILPFGFAASIADFAEIDVFRGHVALARQLGFVGAFCIHPRQVAVLNEEFSPSAHELEEAQAVLQAFEAAVREGRGAAEYRGRMIDAPVAARARELLRRRPPALVR